MAQWERTFALSSEAAIIEPGLKRSRFTVDAPASTNQRRIFDPVLEMNWRERTAAP
jgi:hypothetical protein